MTCSCIEVIDAKLAERNSKLETGFTFGFEGRPSYVFAALRTEKINKKNRDRCGAIPTFCPFCGVKYVTEEEALNEIAESNEAATDEAFNTWIDEDGA